MFFKKWPCCTAPSFSKWSEPREINARDSFSTRVKLIQTCDCSNCGYVKSRTIAEVSSRS